MNTSLLFRIACDPPARVWSGHGDLPIPADIVEGAPAVYLGGGELLTLPDIDQIINGTAGRYDIVLSGIAPDVQALATEEAATVKGAKCHVGAAYFDDDLQLTAVEWIAVLRADFLTTARQGTTRSITLSLGTDNTDRSRAPISFWTDADQRRRSPTDLFCDHVAGITQGTSRKFGPT